jgi:hypothetical protein
MSESCLKGFASVSDGGRRNFLSRRFQMVQEKRNSAANRTEINIRSKVAVLGGCILHLRGF